MDINNDELLGSSLKKYFKIVGSFNIKEEKEKEE